MSRIILIAIVFCGLLLVSSCKCPKCAPVVKVRYLVPEFVCPVPGDPSPVKFTAEDFYISSISVEGTSYVSQADHQKVMGNVMRKAGDNSTELLNIVNLWKGMYYTCIQSIIKLYSNENKKVEDENVVIEGSEH